MTKEQDVTVVTESLAQRQTGTAGMACLVVIYGDNLGNRETLDHRELIIGRGEQAGFQIEQESVSRQHCKIVTQNGTSVVYDLGSTNGTFVNDERVEQSRLHDGDQLRIGQMILKYLGGSNIESRYHEEVYRLTTVDGLTQAYNKRFFVEALQRELNRSRRHNRILSLVLLDFDHFKSTNDTFGHLAGDYVLRETAALVLTNLRKEDIFARYGGEEFAIILPEIDTKGALLVCEKLRSLVEARIYEFDGRTVPVTISLGVSTYTSPQEPDPQKFVAQADAKLYEAKQSGRNTVCA